MMAHVQALAQMPPRDPRPVDREKATTAAAASREAELTASIASNPESMRPRLELAKLQEDSGRFAAAEETLRQARSAAPMDSGVAHALAQYYNRRGQFDSAVNVLEDAARLDPANPQGFHLLGSYYQEKAQRDAPLTPEQKHQYVRAGIDAEDRALALDPDYVDALVYKNILLRMLASLEPDRTGQQRLIAEADALRNRAMTLQKTRTADAPRNVDGSTPLPGAPPPPPPPGAPVRVGGNIPPPRKLVNVNPVYPPDARAAGVQGVVICEALIDPSGRVSDVKVLRSIPMLDEAAVEAVRQWEVTPTHLNGLPVPVIMTVTVNFTTQ
jgi:protein TonB